MRSLLPLWTVCLLLNGLAGSAQELDIRVRFVANYVLVTGNQATLNCQAENYDGSTHSISSYTWRHNGTIIDIDAQGTKYSVDGTGAERDLTINSLSFDDAGKYTCTIGYFYSTDPSQMQSVSDHDMLQIATDLNIEAEPIQYGVAGKSAELRCTAIARPTPTISWFKVLPEGGYSPVLSSVTNFSNIYPISAVQASDAGFYRCTAAYTFGTVHEMIRFVVLNRPTISNSQLDYIQMFGTALSLECPVNSDARTAIHDLTFSWSFTPANSTEAIQLSRDLDSRYSVDPDSGALTVQEVSFEDIGQYRCSASNEAGSDSQIFSVDVESRPMITLQQGPITVRVATGRHVFLDCPYNSNPLPNITWFKGSSAEQVTPSSKYRVHENGTLVISDFTLPSDNTEYRCELSNRHGNDARDYNLQVWDVPLKPGTLSLQNSRDRTVTLAWSAPALTAGSSVFREVEFYVIEQSLNGGEYTQLERVIDVPVTMVTLTGLLPGESHGFRVRAGNFAGLSSPSNRITYIPAPREPSLSTFQAIPLSDGRSMLVTWTLDYDGGPNITQFTIKVDGVNGTVLTLHVDASEEELVISDLDPDTQYTFTVLAINSIGSHSLKVIQNTTSAVPSQPSSLTVTLLSIGSYSLTFSLRQGSLPITHFLVNYTLTNSLEPPSQLTVSIDDPTQVSSIEETDSRVSDRQYWVELRVSGLGDSGEYEFRVAGRSELGDGEFSDWASFENKEHVISVIVAAVVGCMLLVVMVILTAVVIAMCRKRCSKGRKIAINGHGSSFPRSPFDMEANSDAFVLKSPPVGHKEGYFHKSPPMSPSTEDREEITSPLSFTNGYPHSTSSSVTKLNTQTSISGTNLDTVVDMPNNNLSIKIDFHSSTKSVPNNNGFTPPGVVNRQLCLQTSLNSMNLDTGDQHDGRSIASERHLLYVPVPTNTRTEGDNSTLSKSTPVINRLSCDSVLDTMPSYMTDV